MSLDFLRYMLAAMLLMTSLHSCDEAKEQDVQYGSVSVRTPEVSYRDGRIFVYVDVQGDWTISLKFPQDVEPWAFLDDNSGNGVRADIVIDYEENDSDVIRTLTVLVENIYGSVSCTLTQRPLTISDPVKKWMELPEVEDGTGDYFFTHYQQLGEKSIRSWSYKWDVDALVALWVAYPLNPWTIGSGSRTDAWGVLDPKLPRDKQPVLGSGYRGGYDRGHQLPSADRLNRDANIQTFYGTNMTPQLGSLNQEGWAALEGQVRTWARAFDTLYVVTGCTVKGSTKFAEDNDGKSVTVPKAYFKALLGYKKNMTVGNTLQTRGYTACGFYYNHEAYSGNYMNKAMTISQLEERTGIDFFANLPAAIGADLAAVVETRRDEYWWK